MNKATRKKNAQQIKPVNVPDLFKEQDIKRELQLLDDIIGPFIKMLNTKIEPAPGPVYHIIGKPRLEPYTPSDADGEPEGVEDVCQKSGLSREMGVKLLQVLGKEAALLTLDAISFQPAVTFLRANTLKGCRKQIWQDLEASGVKAWLPRWSCTSILVLSHPCTLESMLSQIISQGLCIQQHERQWQRVESTWVGEVAPGSDWFTDLRTKSKDDTAKKKVQPVSIFHSAKGSISSLVILALGAKEGDDVLELCATASGKTSHIAAMMMNSGTLVANTLELCEAKYLEDNLKQMDIKNCVVTCVPPAAISQKKKHSFCRVLVDVPSSGVGVVPKSQLHHPCLSYHHLTQLTSIQRELIINGADCLKQDIHLNSYLVYTTSSLLVEENECIVEYLLKERPQFHLVPTGIDIGTPGFTCYGEKRFTRDMTYTQRIYSHQRHFDGCFIAKFVLESKVKAEQTAYNNLILQTQDKMNLMKDILSPFQEDVSAPKWKKKPKDMKGAQNSNSNDGGKASETLQNERIKSNLSSVEKRGKNKTKNEPGKEPET